MAASKKSAPTAAELAAQTKFLEIYEKLKAVRKSTTLDLAPCPSIRSEIDVGGGKLVPMKLRYYQKQGIYHLMAMKRMLLGDATGVGKTCQLLCSLAYTWMREPENKVIVVAPKSALRQWAGEVVKFTTGIRTILAVGSPAEREIAYRDFAEAPVGPDKEKVILIVNYAILVRDWDAGASRPLLPNGRPDPKMPVTPGLLDRLTTAAGRLTVVYDEAAAFKTQTSKTWQVCRNLSDKAHRCYGLTATMLKNNLMEGFSIMKVIVPSLFTTKSKFMDDYCLSPEHRVLTSRLRWVPIGDLCVGDTLVGFDEERTAPGGRRFRTSVVEGHEFDTLPLFEVVLSDGTRFKATANHKWLTIYGKTQLKWRTTEEILGKHIPRLFNTWGTDDSREAGWLAGIYDGEGWVTKRGGVHVAQNPGKVLDTIKDALSERGFAFVESTVDGTNCRRVGLTGRAREKARFLGQVRPERLLQKFQPETLSRLQIMDRPKVVSVTPIGMGTIVRMQTSTATFIAEGFPHHNCVTKMQPVPGGRKIPIVVGYRNLDQFRSKIDPYFLGRNKHEISNELPLLVTKQVVCELTPAENAKYSEALTGILQLGDGEVKDYEQSKTMTSLIYCQQIVNSLAMLKFTAGDEVGDSLYQDTHTIKETSSKESALLDLLTEELEGEKVIVYTRFASLVPRLQELLKKQNIKSVAITGKVKDLDRKAAQDVFQDHDSDTKVIFITDAGSEAINLQAASAMVFFDAPWSWGTYVQLLGRPIRIGSIHQTVVVYHLVAERPGSRKKDRMTIDQYTLDLLSVKKDLVDKVLGEAAVGALSFAKPGDDMKELLRMMKSSGDGTQSSR